MDKQSVVIIILLIALIVQNDARLYQVVKEIRKLRQELQEKKQ